MPGDEVEKSHGRLGLDHHTVVVLCKQLVEQTTANMVALASRPAGVSTITLESASVAHIQNINLEKPPWIYEILDFFLKDEGRLEFILRWGPKKDST